MPKAIVYIDGFNLYYGAVRGTEFKWLDLEVLSRYLLPKKFSLERVKYFTAHVKALPHDPTAPVRQAVYLRALATLPRVEIVYGFFSVGTKRLWLANPPGEVPTRVKVFKPEEKGSDVNLGAHLLMDGFKGAYDLAVVVTNDSDLASPIKMTRDDLKKAVWVISPHDRQPSALLQQVATKYQRLRSGIVRVSQFPTKLTDAHGEIHKPETW